MSQTFDEVPRVTLSDEKTHAIEGFRNGDIVEIPNPDNLQSLTQSQLVDLIKRLAEERDALFEHLVTVQRHGIESKIQASQALGVAETDALTGIRNKKSWDDDAKKAFEEAKEKGRHLVVGVVDLREFKLVNDQFGHEHGNDALKQAAVILSLNTRFDEEKEEDKDIVAFADENAVVARTGGDEFYFLLKDADIQTAKIVVDRIQSFLEKFRKKFPDSHEFNHLYFDIGIVEVDFNKHADVRAAIEEADKIMYDNKNKAKSETLSEFGLSGGGI